MCAVVDIECSAGAPCPNMYFKNINVSPPSGSAPSYVCINVVNESGLPGKLSCYFWRFTAF